MVSVRLARSFFARLVLLISACASTAPALLAQTKSKPATGTAGIYKGYIVTDAATGKILLEDNAHIETPPASMTKIMTFLIVADALKAGTIALDTPVQITKEDYNMGGTQVYLDPRETFTVEELLYALMIQSANDAATALARAAAGSREIFVQKMNERAQALGMLRTQFTSPHGLPPSSRQMDDSDMTTPADFALLCREAITKTDILKYSSIKKRTFGPERTEPLEMENHNKLLGRVAGVDGLKTGYTKSAGYCLSATAERNGRRIIVVIMGSFGPKGEIDMGRSRDLKTIELIERGFATLQAQSPASPLATAPAASAATPRPTPPSPVTASPVAPTESAPARGNLSAPRRPDASPIAPPEDEKAAPATDEPTVKFVPIAPPVPSKSKSR